MTSPYLQAAQRRIESWERAKMPCDYGVYEPAPLARRRARVSRRFWLIFAALAMAAVIGGGLWVLNQFGGKL